MRQNSRHARTDDRHDELDDIAWDIIAAREDLVEHELERAGAWG